jgi:hypothetical protein
MIFIVVLFVELVLGYVNPSWITMKLLSNQFYVGFPSLIIWLVFNMIPSYYEYGEIKLNSDSIEIDYEFESIYKLEDLESIIFEIKEYEGQSYGPLSASVYQGINNYFKFSVSNKKIEYQFIIKSKKKLISLGELVSTLKQKNVDVKMYYHGIERYDMNRYSQI